MKRSADNGGGEEEAARVRALHDLHALDSPTDARFDRIARLAALSFEAPRAAVVLVDKDRLFLKGQFGVGQRDHPRAGSLADIMVARAQVAIVRDITRDAAFKALLGKPFDIPDHPSDQKPVGTVVFAGMSSSK